MTDKQPEALRLADILQHKIPSIECLEIAATELRRLHQSERKAWRHADELEQERKRINEVNEELFWALNTLLRAANEARWPLNGEQMIPMNLARAAIAKATGEQHG